MQLIRAIALIALANSAAAFDYNYSTILKHPKCCKKNENLALNNGNLTCQSDLSVNQISGGLNDVYPNECLTCVDFLFVSRNKQTLILVNCTSDSYDVIKEYQPFHKCCPLNYVYNTTGHNCMRTNKTDNNLDAHTRVLKLGLSHCPLDLTAIIDYQISDNYEVFDNGSILINDKAFAVDRYCQEQSFGADNLVRVCENYEDVCMNSFDDIGVRCIRKCCHDGFIYDNRKCQPYFISGVETGGSRVHRSKDDPNFAIIQTSSGKKYQATEEHNAYVDSMGNSHRNRYINPAKDKTYCVESMLSADKTTTEQSYFLFIEPENVSGKTRFLLSCAFLSISCVFLFLTFIGYMLLPEMQNLYGKTVMSYCFVTFIAFGVLAYSQTNVNATKYPILCKTLAYLIMYFMLGSFAWLNVICFDMWLAFGSLRVHGIHNKRKELIRFLWYNLYGYGIPSFIIMLTATFNITKVLPDYLSPTIGNKKCFYDTRGYDYLLFFVTPLTLMIVFNCILFLKTIRYCFQVKNEINRMKDTTPSNDKMKRTTVFEADYEKMIMLMKLFTIMGISWLFEVISSVISFQKSDIAAYIEIIWDDFNCLQGLFVFCIFILKKKVLMSLHKKVFYSFVRRRASESSNFTLTTSLSESKNKMNLINRKISETRNNLISNDEKV